MQKYYCNGIFDYEDQNPWHTHSGSEDGIEPKTKLP
jgi:hypothetical protein